MPFTNFIVIVSDAMQGLGEATLVTSGADVKLAPTQLCRLEMLVEYARCHGSRSRYPLNIVFLDDNEIMWR